MAEKLRRLQQKLKKWNWEIFGDVRKNLEETRGKIERLEIASQNNCTDTEIQELSKLKEEFAKMLRWEADILFQKTREKWLKEGDRNTKYFHAIIKDRRRKNTLKLTQADGRVISDNKEIIEGAVEYFRDIFSASPYCLHGDLFQNYPTRASEVMNRDLEAIPTTQEIWDSIQSLSPDSAPGPDGFTGHFFRGCWDIIQADVVEMVKGFFLGDHLNKFIKSTLLILIPKVENPATFNDLRPISLSSFASKIVSKILANRFASILPQIIDEEQFGFVKGRQIHESVALAQELVGDIDRKIEGGNIILKVDMAKAYDRLEWRFLFRALRAIGFSEVVLDLVYRVISDINYRLSINGESSQEFRSTRGVRQGDPLSPLLFIMA